MRRGKGDKVSGRLVVEEFKKVIDYKNRKRRRTSMARDMHGPWAFNNNGFLINSTLPSITPWHFYCIVKPGHISHITRIFNAAKIKTVLLSFISLVFEELWIYTFGEYVIKFQLRLDISKFWSQFRHQYVFYLLVFYNSFLTCIVYFISIILGPYSLNSADVPLSNKQANRPEL